MTSPQPSDKINTAVETDDIDDLPVTPVSEDSKMLDSFLRLCYPCTAVENPSLDNYREIAVVFEATKTHSWCGEAERLQVPVRRQNIIGEHAVRLRHRALLLHDG